MGGMTSAYDLRTTAGRFRLVALMEAVSWAGLLIGMFFKYAGSPRTEIGVKIFGPIHGGVFIAFLVAALFAGIAYKWGIGTWLLALLGSIVPLGSVIFLIWADKTARLGHAGAATTSVQQGGPARPAPEAT
jgi:integral membrane protein